MTPRFVIKHGVFIILFIGCCYLSLKGLDNSCFWDDEAHVAIISRNFLSTGQLTGWDGRNLLAFRNGAILDNNFKIINPPLEYWLCALSFKLFGISTWSGRFPFALAGILSFIVFYFIVRHDFGNDLWLNIYILTLLSLSPVYLLYIRQCRYYSIAIFFALLTFYAYRKALDTKQTFFFILSSMFSLLLFYSNPLLGAAFLLAMGILHVTFYRTAFRKSDWGKMILAIVLFLLGTLPYTVYYHAWNRPDISAPEPWLLRKILLLFWNIRELNTMGCLPWIIVIGLGYFLIRNQNKSTLVKTTLEWGTLALSYTIFIAVFSPQPVLVNEIADIRYLVIAIPFLFGLVGVFLWFINQWNKPTAIFLLMVLLVSNLLTINPFKWNFQWLLPAYIYEIHHDYPTAYQGLVDFLDKNAKQDDLVYCVPEYTNYPLMFYLGNKVRFCCLLDHETHFPEEKIKRLNAPLYIDQNYPNWFISFSYQENTPLLLNYFSYPHQKNGKIEKYSYGLNQVLDYYWRETNRPELPWHSFGPKTDFDRKAEAVYIFKRM